MADKRKKLKRQVSTDGGFTWTDLIPYEYIAGELIQKDSPDCNKIEWRTASGYICEENTTEMTQWVADTGYVCVGTDKYNKEKEQISYNSGISWADTGNTRAGSTLIEQDSEDCDYVAYRWVADTGYMCVGYDKYNKEKEQQSTDGGATWTDTGNTKAGSTIIETDSSDCGYVPTNSYMTITSLEDGNNIKWKSNKASSAKTISVSTDNGLSWVSKTSSTDTTSNPGTLLATLNKGEKLLIKGTNAAYGISIDNWNCFRSSKEFNVAGNIMSLIGGDDFLNTTSFADRSQGVFLGLFSGCDKLKNASKLVLPASTVTIYCYYDMFHDCSSLLSAPALPATTLSSRCYSGMFDGCSSLLSAPALPATTLADWCYAFMFRNCTSLTTSPELPAEILVQNCYKKMFYNSTSLNSVTCCATNKSASDCTTDWLYNVAATGTFNKDANTVWSTGTSGIPSGWTTDTCGCEPAHDYSRDYLTTEALSSGNISLKRENSESPYVVVKTPLTDIKYSKNGGDWTSYKYNTNISVAAGDKIRWKATIKDGNDWGNWSRFVVTAGYKAYGNPLSLLDNDSFVNNPDAIYEYAYHQLFEKNYTLKDISGLALPATILADCCYYEMFTSCESITYVPSNFLPATTLAERCYYSMFMHCDSLTTAPNLPNTTLADSCYGSMFWGCTSLTVAPELPATALSDSCYSGMFQGCTSLTAAPKLPATVLASYCYHYMFSGCTSLTTAPELLATTLTPACYKEMFYECSSLTTAPELPATRLAEMCYESMFDGCTSLTTAPALPATSLANSCYRNMFMHCDSLTTAPALPATRLTKYCYASMFYHCTSLNYIKCIATDISASGCTTSWTYNVSSSGTFVKASSMTSWGTGTDGIPSGWTVQDA